MTLRTDLADGTAQAAVHADQHNQVNAAVLALQAASVDQPWQFRPETYQATAGDGRVATDVATNATQTITSATIAAAATVGQYVMINGGRTGNDVPAIGTITTIAGNNITLTATGAPFNINSTASNLNAVWGTDCTAAFASALAAGKTYAEAHDYHFQLLLADRIYLVAGLTQTNASPALVNTQILVPYPSNNNGRKLVVSIRGTGRDDHYQYWNSTVPNLSGTCIVSTQTAPVNTDATYGVQSVIGAPSGVQGFGGVLSATFVNHKPVIENVQVWMPLYTNMTAFDFTYSGGVYVDGCAAHGFAQAVEGNGQNLNTVTLSDAATFGSRNGRGLRLPTFGNNADVIVPSFTAEGVAGGLWTFSEHALIGKLKFIYVPNPLILQSGAASHGLTINSVTAEQYNTGILVQLSGTCPVRIANWAAEAVVGQVDVSDSGNALRGEIHFMDIVDARRPIVTGGSGVKIIDDSLATGYWSAAPAVPATTVAVAQTAMPWHDAMVAVTGGTVSAITVDGQATGQSLTAGQVAVVYVPAGKTIAVTYTVAPTWKWWLL